MRDFQHRWHTAREHKNSTLVAGLDPAPYALGLDEQGLPQDIDSADALRMWSLAYVDAVAPYVVALKYNAAFFQAPDAALVLPEIIAHARSLDLLIIADAKISDIGSTNNAWCYGHKMLGADAITIAPYAGNCVESVHDAHTLGLAAIAVTLMSNPEYQREMYFVHPETNEPLYRHRLTDAIEADTEAIVVGATYEPNDPVLADVTSLTNTTDTLYLIPGIGAQGGSIARVFETGLDPTRCMLSASRSLMFPKGPNSTAEDQRNAALALQAQLHEHL